MRTRPLLLAWILGWTGAFLARGGESPEAAGATPPVTVTRQMEGWTVHVNRDLMITQTAATQRALDLLSGQLQQIVRCVPRAALAELQKVRLWISPEYPGTPPRAEYHPDAGWLRRHGRDPAMAKAVEFTNVRIFEQESKRMPVLALHELAHAYHDRVLGYQHAGIRAVYAKAKAGGGYEQVPRRDALGRVFTDRAYAMTNPQEYFAETTEAFFGTNDFFPFTRSELQQHDPEMFRLLEEIWEGGRGAADSGKPIPALEHRP